ncbi:RimK family protein [Pararhodospirillum photometricum]|nr:RimK family protein [Pararhodospirillum photometricum]
MLLILSERKPETFPPSVAGLVVTPRAYIADPDRGKAGHPAVRVLNLSGDCAYLGLGYYASLLAEARGHTVLPSVETLVSLNRRVIRKFLLRDLNTALRARLGALGVGVERAPFSLFVAFGATPDPRFVRFARQVWEAFPVPLVEVLVTPCPRLDWRIKDIRPLSARDLPQGREAFFQEQLARVLGKGDWKAPRVRTQPRWSLAVLCDPADPTPASDKEALAKLARAGVRQGVGVTLLTRHDLPRLGEFDALFIRETTNVNHHTFAFARKAEAEGMPVIDDPTSILRCSNKVYLAERLAANGVPTPRTLVVDRRHLVQVEDHFKYPIVLKIPDGSFSRGVVKVEDREALVSLGRRLLASSDLILAQEFMPTAFDWRVGILNGQPLYVSQYMMSRHHWQIVKHNADGSEEYGGFRTFDVADAPAEIVALALRAANLMGNGLYGVDLKETERGCFVIEVNDNPSIDGGVEDHFLKGKLYDTLIGEFVRRLEENHHKKRH